MGTLTAGNSVLTLTVNGVFPVPQKLEGYSATDAFAAGDTTAGVVVMGLDGKLSGSYVPHPVPLTITLQADSPSAVIFDAWLTAQQSARQVFYANCMLSIPSVGSKYAFTRGVLTSASVLPAAAQSQLQPRKWTITFESCSPSPI
ncbi:hypothetical protein [Bordetella sp. LUAb4]|uniref:phage tail fiber protein n=1 Tax=Bordetella sp. LUAb4 TaxID=2843195 RepID=UPI001E50861C|nr:hypothetical protein [Bordetella sp. LUAb4]